MLYIYQYPDWTKFRFQQKVTNALGRTRMQQGLLLGIAPFVSSSAKSKEFFEQDLKAMFDKDSLLITERTFVELAKVSNNFKAHLSAESICNMHALLAPYGGHFRLREGHEAGVLPERIERELHKFINFFNESDMDPVLKAAIAYFWFLTIRPFEFGNKVLASLIAGQMLSLSENTANRHYALFLSIAKSEDFDKILLETQCGNGEITAYLLSFLIHLENAVNETIASSLKTLDNIKHSLKLSAIPMSAREMALLSLLKSGYNASTGISSTAWAKEAGISHDSALRDLQSMVQKGILEKSSDGRGTRYKLKD